MKVADHLLKNENYKLVILLNKDNKISIRHSVKNLDIGKLLKELKWGGGHRYAGGMSCKNYEELMNKVNKLVSRLYKNYNEIRKE